MEAFAALWAILNGHLDAESLHHFVSEAAQADLTSWAVKIALVWVLMGRKVRDGLRDMRTELTTSIQAVKNEFAEHFTAITKGLDQMTTQVKLMSASVAADLKNNNDRMSGLENRVEKLEGGKNASSTT